MTKSQLLSLTNSRFILCAATKPRLFIQYMKHVQLKMVKCFRSERCRCSGNVYVGCSPCLTNPSNQLESQEGSDSPFDQAFAFTSGVKFITLYLTLKRIISVPCKSRDVTSGLGLVSFDAIFHRATPTSPFEK